MGCSNCGNTYGPFVWLDEDGNETGGDDCVKLCEDGRSCQHRAQDQRAELEAKRQAAAMRRWRRTGSAA